MSQKHAIPGRVVESILDEAELAV